MNIQGFDPFLTSLVGTPLREGAATGSLDLNVAQKAAVIGEVIPIVFCRRVGDIGGVLISPVATESRFEDADPSGDITAYYHLVLSEGQIDSIQVRDVFQGACRVGSYTQTFNRRAGTFVPGNFINNSPNLEAPRYCGTGGSYAGMSTMAFNVTIPAGFDYWDRQVHCFIRGGMRVTRLLDTTLGPSNNVVDLLLYLLQNSSRVSNEQTDTSSLLEAARFTNTNGLLFNGVVAESKNLRDWMKDVLQYFLLRSTRVGGKEALRPLLPYMASTGAINTGPVSWAFNFTEEHIVPGSFQITYTPLADRKPFCAVMLWRQHPTDDIGIVRSTEVRYTGTAVDGPFEQHDLSEYCASENHAVKVGAYILSRRKHVTHTLSITVKPDSFNPTLTTGDLVRVRLERTPSTGASSLHNYLYEIDRIAKSVGGDVLLELTEFPVDDQLRSVVALEVNSAAGNGVSMPTGITGITCDINSLIDTSVPAEVGSDVPGFDGAYDFNLGGSNSSGLGDFGTGNAGGGLSGQGAPGLTSSGNINDPATGDTLTAPTICEGGQVTFYRLDPSVEGGRVIAAQATSTYTLEINDIDKSVYAEIVCPDPSSPTGFGEPISTAPTPIIRDDPNNSPWFYIGVPTSVALEGTFTSSATGRKFCSSGADAPDLYSSGNLVNQGVINVIQWRVLFLTASCAQTCGSGGTATGTSCRIEGKRADGTTVLSNAMQGSSCNPLTTGIEGTTTTSRTITVVKYDGITMPLSSFFP